MIGAHPTIEELPIPASLDGPGGAAFAEMVESRNVVEAAAVGTDALAVSPAALLPTYQDQEYDPAVVFVARDGGRIVGRGVWSSASGEDTSVSWVEVGVVPSHRRRGIGTALLESVEFLAADRGHPTLQSEILHTHTADAVLLASPTGFGGIPASDPGARFLTRHGYRLEQVSRISALALPVGEALLGRLEEQATAAAGAGYRLVSWEGATPERWLADIAHLRGRMERDAPIAGLEMDEEIWDEARVVAHDRREARSGSTTLVVAAEHVSTGRLVGFSELAFPEDPTRPVSQEDTLVLIEHRGHRLGMLLKVSNLRRLADLSPSSRLVITGNAEENRHMLDINEALGFQPLCYEGGWRKNRDPVPS